MRPKLKICGLTELEQTIKIAKMGVDALGFILFPGSPRYITPEKVALIIQKLPPLVKTVGVFVDTPKEQVLSICQSAGLDLAQLHGHESPAECRWLTRKGQPWIKAIPVRGKNDLDQLATFECSGFLLDTKSQKGFGGTGETFDWSIAAQVSRRYQVILAGGLGAHNLSEAVCRVRPYGLDLSSSIETEPGVKDMKRVQQLISVWRAL